MHMMFQSQRLVQAHLANPVEAFRLGVASADASPGEAALLLVEAERLGSDAGAVGRLGSDARPVLLTRAYCGCSCADGTADETAKGAQAAFTTLVVSTLRRYYEVCTVLPPPALVLYLLTPTTRGKCI